MTLTKTIRKDEQITTDPKTLVGCMQCERCIHESVCKWRELSLAKRMSIVVPHDIPCMEITMNIKCTEFLDKDCISIGNPEETFSPASLTDIELIRETDGDNEIESK